MNCAQQLVELFGSQADVARAFQLDRAVVSHWVRIGYVPTRWAGEVVVCVNGVFGGRMLENVVRCGGVPVVASQKCLSCTPGLSPVSFSEPVVERVKRRKDKIHSWFMDMNLLLGYWGATTRTYHHTAPTNSLFALHEALLLIREEGLENACAVRPDGLLVPPGQRDACLPALGSVLSDMGLPVHVGDAEAAAHGAYAQMHAKDAQRKKRAA